MRVKEVLAIGRKIGPETFSQYRNFIKSARNQSVEKAALHLDLRGVNIMDTIKFNGPDEEAFPEVRKILKALHKKYFPRAGSEQALKSVDLSFNRFDKDTTLFTVNTQTKDEEGEIGKSLYKFFKTNRYTTMEGNSNCEDFKFNFLSIFDTKELRNGERKHINLQWGRDCSIEEKEGLVQLKMQSPAGENSQVLRMEMEMPKSKIERLFGDAFNQDVADAMKNIDLTKFKL